MLTSDMNHQHQAIITEDWLRDCGFKWEQLDRQPSKHWLLWIGLACIDCDRTQSPDSLGIELAKVDRAGGVDQSEWWYCWLRSDFAGRYSRLLHVRYVAFQSEVEAIVAALTGRAVDWRDSMYGCLQSPQQAERLRRDRMRLDQRIGNAWCDRVDAEKGISGIDKDKRGCGLP